jgi:uncharacterized protein YbjT (DUF2867 family)
MKVVVFGASGMVGQGVLRECLRDPDVEAVLSIGRSSTGREHPKLRELQHHDFTDFSTIAGELAGWDACFFCLGVSSAGMSEKDYRHVTYDFTLAAARVLAERSPGMTFVYVSGAGTGGDSMWARVKAETEAALVKLPFKAAYMFRPGYIQPVHGETSKTRWARVMYAAIGSLYPVWKTVFPRYVTTTEKVARAMVVVAARGADKRILENDDINALAAT